MEVKKAIRKVIALGAGATMVGATLFSAMAADLSAFPAPFVKDGVFDALIVVGATAASEDVVGAVDIGASMQFELKKETPVSVGGSDVLISSGIKIKGTGSEVLNYNESLGEVRTTAIDDIDMPVTLAQGRYTESEGANDNDVTYTQIVTLNDTNGVALHDQPDDGYNMDDYLELYDTSPIYKYALTFDDQVQYDNSTTTTAKDDLEGTTLEIQGNLYTITKVKTASGKLSEITLMAGETLLWLTQDQVITKTVAGVDHEVKVVDVTDDEDSCGVSVDGDMAWITVGSSKTINGVDLGVLDAKAVHAQLQDVDVCELNIGATEILLKDGDRLQRDGVDVKDAHVIIDSVAKGEWNGFSIEMTPEDNIFLAKDKEYVDPALGNIKFVMGGVMTPREDIKLEKKGSKDAMISFTNNDGKLVEVPMQIDTNGVNKITWGKSDTKPLLFEGDVYPIANIENSDGTMLFAVTSGGTAHVIEISNIDVDTVTAANSKIDLKDLTYGRSWSDKQFTEGAATNTIDLGSLGSITLVLDDGVGINATDVTAYSATAGESESNYGANVKILDAPLQFGTGLAINATANILRVTEADLDDSNLKAEGPAVINLNIMYDAANDKTMEATLSSNSWAIENYGSNDKVDSNSDVEVYTTGHGTLVEEDADKSSYVLIQYPKEEVEVNAFVAPVSAQITTRAGAITTVTLPKLNVGAARLDSEISDWKAQNLIIVGGPCANSVAASALGVPFAVAGCEAGFTEGKAIVKLVDSGAGKVAMVVAGMSAMDTRRATRVVANSEAYTAQLTGTEVVVTGTSLTDIKVSAPQ